MLQIQEFLKKYPDIVFANSELVKQFAINIVPDTLHMDNGTTESVWVYNYNRMESFGDKKIENEARGLILNENADIVSFSFQRFFNPHEQHASDIVWRGAIAETKYDGSLIVIYSYKGSYFIQTRGLAEASGRVLGESEKTYKDAIIELLSKKFDSPFWPFTRISNDERYCWAFEFVSPCNRLVTPYEESELVLLAGFEKKYASEVYRSSIESFAERFGFSMPERRSVHSLEQVIDLTKDQGKLEEGFVVVDQYKNRIKVKNKSFLVVSRIVNAGNQLSPLNFARIVLNGDTEEIASYYDEYSDILILMQSVLGSLLDEVNDVWLFNRDLPSRKEFAAAIKDQPLKHILFGARSGMVTNSAEAVKLIRPKFLVSATEGRFPANFKKSYEKALSTR